MANTLSQEKLNKIYDAYSSGKMSPEAASNFENDYGDFISNKKTGDDLQSLVGSEAAMFNSAPEEDKRTTKLDSLSPAQFTKIENAYNSGLMAPEAKENYERDKKTFMQMNRIGADSKVRLAVGAESEPSRRLAVLKSYHPEAERYGDDNFIIQKDGKTTIFNPEGFDIRDISGAAPELIGGAAGVGTALATGGTAAAIGGSAVADAAVKRGTQEIIRAIMGNNDVADIKPESFQDKTKEVLTDTALGVTGGAVGHGLSVGVGAAANKLDKLLRPMDAKKAQVITSILDNADPEIKEALKNDGLLLSTAYPSVAKFEGVLSKMPIIGDGIEDASKVGGKVLNDAIEQAALKKAGVTSSDLIATQDKEFALSIKKLQEDLQEQTGKTYSIDDLKQFMDGTPFGTRLSKFAESKNPTVESIPYENRSSTMLDDLTRIKRENGKELFDSVNEKHGTTQVDLGEVLDHVYKDRLEPLKSIPELYKSEKQSISDLLGFDISKFKTSSAEDGAKLLEMPEFKAVSKAYQDINSRLRNGSFTDSQKRDALNLKNKIADVLDEISPEWTKANQEYAKKSLGEDILRTFRGGTPSADLPPGVTSPSTFNTKFNKESRSLDPSSVRMTDALKDAKVLSTELARSKMYENSSNTAAGNAILGVVRDIFKGQGGAGLAGASIGAYGPGQENRSFTDIIKDAATYGTAGYASSKVAKGLLKNQAEKAIRRSVNPNETLDSLKESARPGGALHSFLTNIGRIAADKIN